MVCSASRFMGSLNLIWHCKFLTTRHMPWCRLASHTLRQLRQFPSAVILPKGDVFVQVAILTMTSKAHSIRLHGPWALLSCEPQNCVLGSEISLSTNNNRSLTTVYWKSIPQVLSQSNCVIERSFNRPTGLAPEQRVELVLATQRLDVAVFLNQFLLGKIGVADTFARYPISSLLSVRNRIKLILERQEFSDFGISNTAESDQRPLLSDVRLEIFE